MPEEYPIIQSDKQNTEVALLQQESDQHEPPFAEYYGRLRAGLNFAKRSAQTGIVIAELLPTNEAIRYGALTAALASAGPNPVVGGLVLGGTTLLVEGGAALATASLLDTHSSKKAMTAINTKVHKVFPEGKTMTPMVEAGVAMMGGSAVVLAEKQRENPLRTISENRRHGLFTASWMSGVFTIQGAAIALGIDALNFDPLKTGAGLIALGGVAAAAKKIHKKLKNNSSDETSPSGDDSFVQYELTLYRNESPQHVGLDKDDFERAQKDSDVIYSGSDEADQVHRRVPILVPTKSLYWYNQQFLDNYFGDRNTFFYSQAPVNNIDVEKISQVINRGDVVLLNSDDTKADKKDSLVDALIGLGLEIDSESVGDAFLNQYVGEIQPPGVNGYRKKPTLAETYREDVENGKRELSDENGASIVEIIHGDEAERLWEIYQEPFDQISETSPISAGFDRDGFMEALKDPSVVKIINKIEGKISTLAMFVTDFKHAPWLNEDFYKTHHTEAYETGNILIFTGIVSDEKMRGGAYAANLMNLLLDVNKGRNTRSIITFECNEVSSNYLPQLVEKVINDSGSARVVGLNKEIAHSRFMSIRKKADRD